MLPHEKIPSSTLGPGMLAKYLTPDSAETSHPEEKALSVGRSGAMILRRLEPRQRPAKSSGNIPRLDPEGTPMRSTHGKGSAGSTGIETPR